MPDSATSIWFSAPARPCWYLHQLGVVKNILLPVAMYATASVRPFFISAMHKARLVGAVRVGSLVAEHDPSSRESLR